ncbi:MAG TPA: hypothetical protein VKI20_06515, partial [Acidimicrobiales bacterium]|nr:hypothetical protein [Acidimicrobiales bacterium]
MLGVVAADGVHEITPDGAHDYRVAGTDGNSQEPAWSADGSRVAFSQRDPGHRTASGNPAANLVVADVAPRCWTALSLQRADAFDWPLWSRDGRGLTYLRHPDGSYMVDHPMYLEMSASDGSGARRLAAVRSPAPWAPDGSGRLVFSDTEGLKLRNPNGQVKTLDAVPDSEFASWSPDSSRILFSVSTNSAVWVVNADGSGLRALTPTFSRSGAFVFFESWSPDGARIAFVRDCCAQPGASSQSDVWVVNADGSDAHAVTSS